MVTSPIADLAFLSDRHSSALVSRSGSVEWLGFPRFDSPTVFGRLLGQDAGHWQIHSSSTTSISRKYLPQSLVMETTFTTTSGRLVVTDLLALGPDNGGHRLGTDVPHLLIRRVACPEGEVEVVVDYSPRPEYGLVVPLLRQVNGGVTGRGGAEELVLSCPFHLQVADGRATGRCTLSAGDQHHLALHRSSLEERGARIWEPDELAAQVANTIDAWSSWSSLHQSYAGPWADLVHHSGRVLQGLSFQPSGAIVAAATTSLPEEVGGERNWDYRYCWLRDASLTMEALWVAACPDEAQEFFSFITAAAAGSLQHDQPLQIMFGVGGEQDLSERELGHLEGWRDSRPVRVGNGAWQQQQIDVYGEVLSAARLLVDQLGEIDDEARQFLVRCADTAAAQWSNTDQGIWEVRGDSQHFLYSKVMCWVALDRALQLADHLDAHHRTADWTRTRDEIEATVLAEGWSEEAGAFTQYFGSTALDASALMMTIVGFLPARHPKMLATIDAIDEHLTDDLGLVYRYRTEEGVDGLAGAEGTFLLCTFWLAQALALAGQVDRARTVFERAIAWCNDVGLLAEEVDGTTGELMGNFPQAFSHIGLINAAWAISEAERHTTNAS